MHTIYHSISSRYDSKLFVYSLNFIIQPKVVISQFYVDYTSLNRDGRKQV